MLGLKKAVLETFGRFFNSGEENDDERCQREFFGRFNGPRIIHSKSPCQPITRRLLDGFPNIDLNNNNIRRLEPGCRDSTVFIVIASLTESWRATTSRKLEYLQNFSS